MRPGPSPRVVLAVVAFGVFIAADDLTVVSTMLRDIVGDLEIPLPEGFDDAAWIVNSYLVAYVAVMPFMGRLSDIVGRRAVYVGALTLFLIGSIWIPLAGSLPWFVAGRVLTAIGGGAMVPVAIAVVGDVFAERRRPTALGVLGGVDTIGWVWGPLFGALLVRYLSWQWQFHLNIPLALAGIAASWWALRGLDRPARGARLDWPGAAALSVALVTLNIGLLNLGDISGVSELAELSGEQRASSVPFFVIAAVAIGTFVWLELRSDHPLIDLGIFRRRDLTAAVAVNFLVGAVLVIAMVDVPLFVNLVVETDLEQAAVVSGWVLSAMTATMAVAAVAGGVLTGPGRHRAVILAGLGVTAAGFLAMGLSWDVATMAGAMAWQVAVVGLGIGLVTAPTNDVVVAAAPPDRRGTAAGLVILFRLMGLAVGLSGLTAWGLYRFETGRSRLVLPPLDDPGYADAVEAAQAELTAAALTETFLFSVAVLVLALGVAALVRRAQPSAPAVPDEPGPELEPAA